MQVNEDDKIGSETQRFAIDGLAILVNVKTRLRDSHPAGVILHVEKSGGTVVPVWP